MREACVQFVSEQPLSPLMQHARNIVQQSGIADSLIRVLTEQYVLSALKKPETRDQVFGIFVLEQLSGSIYDELRKRSKENDKCRIIRPIVIVQSHKLDSDLRIPFKTHPLMSLAMYDMAGITLAGDLTTDERHELSRRIMLMGGTALSSVTAKKTSVVVSRNMSDTRCAIARDMRPLIPILKPEWVNHWYTESLKDNIISAKSNYDKFRLPAFAGLTITPAQVCLFFSCSAESNFFPEQIESEKRRKLQQVAEKYGFTYHPNLEKNITIHLVCERAEGDKWQKAREWGMFTVSYDWVRDSIANGQALPEKGYIIGPDNSRNEDDLLFQDRRLQRKSASKDRRRESDNQPGTSSRRVRRSDSPTAAAGRDSDGADVPFSVTQTLRSFRFDGDPVTDPVPVERELSFTEKHAYLNEEDRQNDIFDGVEFGIVSCDAEKKQFFCKLVRNNSGYLHNGASDDDNYVLIGKDEVDDEAKEVMKHFRENGSSATFVSYKWLIACAEKGTLEDSEPYQYNDEDDDADSQSLPVAEQSLGFKVTKRDYSQRNDTYTKLSSIRYSGGINETIDDSALINQYSRRNDSHATQRRTSGPADDDDVSVACSQWKHASAERVDADVRSQAGTDFDDCSIISFPNSQHGRRRADKTLIDFENSSQVGHCRLGSNEVQLLVRNRDVLKTANDFNLVEIRDRHLMPPATRRTGPPNRK